MPDNAASSIAHTRKVQASSAKPALFLPHSRSKQQLFVFVQLLPDKMISGVTVRHEKNSAEALL